MSRIAINGLGRIGKLVLRALVDDGAPGEIVLLNDPVGTPDQHAHLFEFDTVHGRWAAEISHDSESVTINGTRMQMRGVRAIDDLPLAEMGIDLVINQKHECAREVFNMLQMPGALEAFDLFAGKVMVAGFTVNAVSPLLDRTPAAIVQERRAALRALLEARAPETPSVEREG